MYKKVAVIWKKRIIAQVLQKKYANQKCRELHFEVGRKVFLKVVPRKGIMRFRKKGKPSTRYLGLFDVLEIIGVLAYRLALPPQLSAIYDIFHISRLREYIYIRPYTCITIQAPPSSKYIHIRGVSSRDSLIEGSGALQKDHFDCQSAMEQ